MLWNNIKYFTCLRLAGVVTLAAGVMAVVEASSGSTHLFSYAGLIPLKLWDHLILPM